MKRLIGAGRRVLVAGLALALLTALAGLVAVGRAPSALAADTPPPVSCPPGSSCYLWLRSLPGLGGSGGNNPIPVQPPPCPWDPEGNAQTGSQYLVNYYNGTAPAQNAPNSQYASFTQAEQMLASKSTERGEWYFRPDRQGQPAVCASEPRWFFAVPGEPLPGGTLVPVTLGELATATLKIPGAGRMYLSPTSGTTYSNLPTFVRVAFNRAYEIGPGGDPYVTAHAAVQGAAATVWVVANPLQLSTNDSSATPYPNGCGYLGSQEMVLHPKQVAKTGANGTADCGVTFHQPGTWTITATVTWRTCWVPEVAFGPPPADCVPVPGAQLNPVTWNRNVAVHEIQAANGG